MRSNYKRLGDYIHKVDNRNRDLKVNKLLGLSMTKEFRQSTSNIIGTDMSVYKVVEKWQFACDFMSVIRVFKLPVVLKNDDEPIIVSPAYTVFEVNDTNELHPEYLMMWFRRAEFDRYAVFKCDSAIRGGFEWVELCNSQLPIPSINKQRQLVNEYHVLVDRINLNNRLIQKLEETAQAVYKEWFVDFEFPDPLTPEGGTRSGYKSRGGEMVESEMGMIPKGWKVESFTKVLKLSGGGTPSTDQPEYWGGKIPFYTPGDLTQYYYSIDTYKKMTELGLKKCSSKLYPPNTTFVTARGATVGGISLAGVHMAMNQTCYAINGNSMNDYFAHQLTLLIISKLKTEAIGATFEALVTKNFDEQLVIEPNKELIELFGEKVNSIYNLILKKVLQNQKLSELKDLLLSKLATI
jgi:type I restriction enzyme S subunit